MGRFRNPRYAPEWLERRLSPSALGATIVPPPAEYAPADDRDRPRDRDDNGDPIPYPIPLPPPGPEIPR